MKATLSSFYLEKRGVKHCNLINQLCKPLSNLALLFAVTLNASVVLAEPISHDLNQNSISTTSDDWLAKHLKLHMFGTLGGVYHDESGLKYRRNIEQAGGAEGGKIDFTTDSVLGAQANLAINEVFSGNMMVVSRKNAFNEWDPELALASLNINVNNHIDLRVGRIGANVYIGAESRFVGYSFITVRPSPDSFGLFAQLDRIDGINPQYQTNWGEGVARVGIHYGKTVGKRNIIYATEITNSLNKTIYFGYEQQGLNLLAVYSKIKSTDQQNFTPLRNTLSNVGASGFPQATVLANNIAKSVEQNIEIVEFGGLYEHQQLEFQTNLTIFSYDAFPSSKGWNAGLLMAYHMDNFTPYVSISRAVFKPEKEPLNLPAIPAFSTVIAAYNNVSDVLKQDRSTLSLGFRYDINEQYAFKVQAEHIKANTDILITNQGLGARNVNMNVLSVALDFLF